jgi:uncharacterized protein DUF6879
VNSDLAALGQFVGQARRSLFRLETLDHYDVSSDGGDFQRYVRGEDGPDMERKAAWHKALQANLDRGLTTRRVHVVRSPLSDYLRYEFDWGYAYNLAYEDIRILDLAHRIETAATGRFPAALEGLGDFWLIDGSAVALMHYDQAGRYLGFDAAPDEDVIRYARAAEAVWAAAIPFADYRAGRRVA